jgi:predicted nucleic acid-binding protein
VARLILLDANVLGLLVGPGPKPGNPDRQSACQQWLVQQRAVARVGIPAITDYEVRRELERRGATAQIARLNALLSLAQPVPVTPDAWRRAAEFWALIRGRTSQTGQPRLPTAPDLALDGDAILAGVAATIGGEADEVVVASTNSRHLSRFPGITSRSWEDIE